MIQGFLEFKSESDFEPIKSFKLKDNLNPKVWNNFELNEDIKKDLLKIGEDAIDNLELDIEINDVILTGSMVNYNWSEYSDFDVHIIFDFSQIDKNEEIVSKYLKLEGRVWNEEHNIQIDDYDVEIYFQNKEEFHQSAGIYSLLNDKWIKKPNIKDFELDEELIETKSSTIIDQIDELEKDCEDDVPYDKFIIKWKKVWKKIKDGRKAGLEEDGEYSIENLVFKLLRRNERIKQLIELKSKAYDRQFK